MIIPFHVREMLERTRVLNHSGSTPQRMPPGDEKFFKLPRARKASACSLDKYWELLLGLETVSQADKDLLADPASTENAEQFSANIENFIGTVKVPVGIIGPLRINGRYANGDFYVPMATTEAALVASYARGACASTESGGMSTAVLYEGVIRTPAFVFYDLLGAQQFVEWIVSDIDNLQSAAEATTNFGKLVSVEPVVDNNIVFLICRYTTGDAAGQNMVTIATNALCKLIVCNCPIQIKNWYIEGNLSGDKKASFLGLITGRGRKVTASVTLSADVVERTLKTSVESMLDYGRVADLGSHLSGQIGAEAHFANGLAAFYIATGQDAACVAESAVGITRMEARGKDLFCSVTMPNILVGSVGGGTGLPTQSAGLNILGLKGAGKGAALAEVVAATCLCGEISIVAAIAAGHFAHAHESLARHR